mmetsp:Transcript_10639/g.27608  ORF Transcript_10639/g.27608 Transcript_10639/m.27608 type:complete len:231 (-) Transcript_10639:190-882(-)
MQRTHKRLPRRRFTRADVECAPAHRAGCAAGGDYRQSDIRTEHQRDRPARAGAHLALDAQSDGAAASQPTHERGLSACVLERAERIGQPERGPTETPIAGRGMRELLLDFELETAVLVARRARSTLTRVLRPRRARFCEPPTVLAHETARVARHVHRVCRDEHVEPGSRAEDVDNRAHVLWSVRTEVDRRIEALVGHTPEELGELVAFTVAAHVRHASISRERGARASAA